MPTETHRRQAEPGFEPSVTGAGGGRV